MRGFIVKDYASLAMKPGGRSSIMNRGERSSGTINAIENGGRMRNAEKYVYGFR
jgi:hypothetical protein